MFFSIIVASNSIIRCNIDVALLSKGLKKTIITVSSQEYFRKLNEFQQEELSHGTFQEW